MSHGTDASTCQTKAHRMTRIVRIQERPDNRLQRFAISSPMDALLYYPPDPLIR
jgi:hypothetical protein